MYTSVSNKREIVAPGAVIAEEILDMLDEPDETDKLWRAGIPAIPQTIREGHRLRISGKLYFREQGKCQSKTAGSLRTKLRLWGNPASYHCYRT